MHTRTATPTCRQTHTHTLELNCFGSFCLAAASAPLFLSECRTSFILLHLTPFLPPSLFLMLILIPISIPVPCSFVCQSLMKCPMNCDPKIKAKLNARSRSLIDRKRCSTQLIHPKIKKKEFPTSQSPSCKVFPALGGN